MVQTRSFHLPILIVCVSLYLDAVTSSGTLGEGEGWHSRTGVLFLLAAFGVTGFVLFVWHFHFKSVTAAPSLAR